MSFVKRFKRLLSAKVEEKVEKETDPAKRVRKLVCEMKAHVAEGRATLAIAVRDERRMERQVHGAKKEVERWHINAKQALEVNKESLAREALKRKLGAKKFLDDLLRELEKLRENVQTIKKFVIDLERKLKEAQTRERMLLQKQRRLKQANFLKERFPERKQELLRAALDSLEDDTDKLAYETLLLEEDPLEKRFRELEDREELVDDELAELKRDLDEDAPTQGRKKKKRKDEK
mgnify:CR=1 FL=1